MSSELEYACFEVNRKQHSLVYDSRGNSLTFGEIVDRLNECREYHAMRLAEQNRLLLKAQNRIADLCVTIGNIEQCRAVEGDSVCILCDDPDADENDKVCAVEACGDYTGYEPQRFYGRSWEDALAKAAAWARRHYSDEDRE